MAELTAVVLAAGKGTRMKSDLAKVLHRLGGRPLVTYPIDTAVAIGATRVVIVTGYQEEAVRAAVVAHVGRPPWLRFATQAEQNGTGHAVICALDSVPEEGPVVVMNGDVPLLSAASLRKLVEIAGGGAAICTFEPEDTKGMGRIVRNADGTVLRIREERDASAAELALAECNAGIYCFPATALHGELPRLGTDNAQSEVYLTDLVEAVGKVVALPIPELEARGVNTVEQLADLEQHVCR
jgi:bifunctional UDP-N-acetylglucosamine pyrophosphorylase/glucosamine-1-phosphate N-acetyltransferase